MSRSARRKPAKPRATRVRERVGFGACNVDAGEGDVCAVRRLVAVEQHRGARGRAGTCKATVRDVGDLKRAGVGGAALPEHRDVDRVCRLREGEALKLDVLDVALVVRVRLDHGTSVRVRLVWRSAMRRI